jgi:hypothetical protein
MTDCTTRPSEPLTSNQTFNLLRRWSTPLPNMRLQLAGAIVLMEGVRSCPGGHGTASTARCAGAPVARSLSAIRYAATVSVHMTRSPTLVFSLLALLEPRPALACTCRATRSPHDALAQADAVFVGRVLSRAALRPIGIGLMGAGPSVLTRDRQADMAWGLAQVRVMFAVSRAWKGVEKDTIAVDTGSGGGDCGYPFYLDGVYLVYASRLPERSDLYAGSCGRTKGVAEAAGDLAALGRASYAQTGRGRVP